MGAPLTAEALIEALLGPDDDTWTSDDLPLIEGLGFALERYGDQPITLDEAMEALQETCDASEGDFDAEFAASLYRVDAGIKAAFA